MTDTDRHTYRTDGYRPIKQSAEIMSIDDAARIFGNRVARRVFGRGGYLRTIRHDCRSMDGRTHTYEIFIGRNGTQPGETVGHNDWLYVYVD